MRKQPSLSRLTDSNLEISEFTRQFICVNVKFHAEVSTNSHLGMEDAMIFYM